MTNSLEIVPPKCGVSSAGAVYTPNPIAHSMVSHCEKILGKKRTLRVLEPSVGEGAFLDALKSSDLNILSLTAVDLDHLAIDQLRRKSKDYRFILELHHCDFLKIVMKSGNDPKHDLIIGNPPFIKYNNFTEEFSNNTTFFADKYEIPTRDLKNAWAVFLVAAQKMLSPDGLLAFILPYEILTVEYGKKALKSALAGTSLGFDE